MMEQMSSVGSSLRSHISIQIDNDDAESVSEAGDIGDRALPSRRYSERSSFSLSFDHRSENGAVVRPLPPELSSPLPTNAIVGSGDTKHVGSFLMGWFGVVFKADISHVSEHLAIAITTGYLGSLTTFSGWNQKMVNLSVSGYWLFSALGFLIGLFLVAFSIIFGVETAKGFRWLLNRMNKRAGSDSFKINWKMDNYSRQLAVMVVLLVVLGLLWGVSAALVKSEFKHGGSYAQLWFACMVGPLGVWIRWFLARFNGRGLGRTGLLKWIPFGTLAANISAASIMATLASVNKAVSF
ncbi:membrane protein [Spatholobus suberectus]|nr:membrane protein [Spatholobus suberectus]